MTAKRYDCTQSTNGYELGCAYMEAQPDGDYVRFEDYERVEKAAGEMAESIRDLLPHCDEPKMEGETGFERAWILARTALTAYDAAKEGK